MDPKASTPSQSEGDVNRTPLRAAWQQERLDEASRELLARDSAAFLHQSVSTPCLAPIVKAEGLYIEDLAGRRYLDFHGNNVHHLGHGHPEVIAAIKAQLDTLSFAPRRFEIKRVADEDILVADVQLSRTTTTLDEVRVTANRSRVTRNDQAQDVAGTERVLNPNTLDPAQQGDLAAMAANTPGVLYVPGQDGDPSGFSVLGLGADQNQTTLNGMNFGGAGLPRDAGVSSGLATSPYDVSRGGFSGGQFNLRTRSGSNFSLRNLSMVGDAPQLQWTDAAARAQHVEEFFGPTDSGDLIFLKPPK